jgi:hypothetical protein
MNERIKELAEQAGISLSQKDYSYYWVESAEDKEKFAELIVRECVNRVKSKADRWGTMTDEIINECVLDCAKDLREHFGVEE